MGQKIQEWKREIISHKWLILLSIIFFITANILNYLAGNYADKKGSAAVSDLLLDFLPSINLSILDIYGYTAIVLIIFIYPLLFKVKEMHIVVSQFSLLLIIRSFFISLTHLKMPIDAILNETPKLYSFLTFHNDLFFSGHVAFTFLGFLLFRKEKVRVFFLIATIIMALTVLLMHVHYSIDVFAALFITYGSYKIGERIFTKINHYNK